MQKMKLTSVLFGVLFLICTAWSSVFAQSDSNRDNGTEPREVHILFAADVTGRFKTWSVFGNMVKLAISHINNRSDILPGYNIVPHFMDSGCVTNLALHNMYKNLYSPPTKIMIIGPTCSHVCVVLGDTSHLWNISMISGSCVTPAVSDKTVYPRFFRTSTSDLGMTPTRIKLMGLFNWNKIAFFHQAEGPFAPVTEYTRKLLTNTSATILTTEVIGNEPRQQLQNLKDHDSRIIMGGTYLQHAVNMYCEAYRMGFYGPHIIWVLPGWWEADWWSRYAHQSECSAEELLATVQDSFYIAAMWRNQHDVPSLSGLVQSDVNRLVDLWNNYTMPNLWFIGASYYDATMTAALALNITQNILTESGDKRTIADFNYLDRDIGDLITSSLFQVSFQGIKGYIKFDKNGDIPTNMEIFQQKGEERRLVGWHDVQENVFNWEGDGITWIGGKPPVDATTIVLKMLFVMDPVYFAICAVAGICIFMSLFFLGFNIHYRNLRIIKMSSPNINTLVIIGCILSYSAVFFELREKTFDFGHIICTLKTTFFLIGFSMAFGGLFSKTWRVHMILTKSLKSAKKTVISDNQLFGIVAGLVLVDIIVLVVWQVYDPFRVEVHNLTTQAHFGESMLIYQVPSCTSAYATYFKGALFVIQGMMLVFGAFLAWETRKVKLEALNDSKLIGVCIYNVTVLSIMGVAISLVIKDNPNSSYAFTSGFIVFGTMLTSGVLFFPKVVSVKKGGAIEPEGTTTTGTHTMTMTVTGPTGD